MASSLPATTTRKSRFDFFGFTSLSVGPGALQLLLDRGRIEDWFSSTQIWIETAIAYRRAPRELR
jgi:DHA2 family multidrug resistance protein